MPVRVQGAEAPAEIAGALRYANTFQVADLIITGRGGGSLEDLWAFNDERVVRAIFASEIPVISAVGHEPDVTISDYVADRRAATPSNAAEIAVPDRHAVAEDLRSSEVRLGNILLGRIAAERRTLEGYRRKRVLSDAGAFLDMRRMEADRLQDRLVLAIQKLILQKRSSQEREAAALDAMSPLKVMARGYLLATDAQGTEVRSAALLHPGDTLRLRLADGRADCRVEQVEMLEGDRV